MSRPAVRHAGRDDDDVAGLHQPRDHIGSGDLTPLQDGPFRIVVTALSGAGLAAVDDRPPVTSVPVPETMT